MAPSKRNRVIPDKRMIAVLVYLTACMQVIGFSWKALHETTTLAQYLTVQGILPIPNLLAFNQIYIGIMIAALVAAFFRFSAWPFYAIGVLFLIESIFRTVLGQSSASNFALVAECSRYLWFLAIGYALSTARTLDVEIGLPSVRLLLRLGLALTFITHGVEAIMRHPGFLDGGLFAPQALPFVLSESWITNGLMLIGLVDVLVGLLVLIKPNRTALVYMALWGFLTAYSRMFIAPSSGFFEGLIRAPHYMLPFLIMILEGQRSIRKPIRHVYSRTLRKMGLASSTSPSSSPYALKRSSHDA